jgi:hypothetical protein
VWRWVAPSRTIVVFLVDGSGNERCQSKRSTGARGDFAVRHAIPGNGPCRRRPRADDGPCPRASRTCLLPRGGVVHNQLDLGGPTARPVDGTPAEKPRWHCSRLRMPCRVKRQHASGRAGSKPPSLGFIIIVGSDRSHIGSLGHAGRPARAAKGFRKGGPFLLFLSDLAPSSTLQ